MAQQSKLDDVAVAYRGAEGYKTSSKNIQGLVQAEILPCCYSWSLETKLCCAALRISIYIAAINGT